VTHTRPARFRRFFAGGLAALLGTGGCTAAPAEPVDPPASGNPPAVGFTATVTVEGQAIRISYQLVNQSPDELIVLNRVPAYAAAGTQKADPNSVYIVGRAKTHTVEIAKRAYPMPETGKKDWGQAARVTGITLPPGQSVSEELTVPLPLQRRHPYGDDFGEGTIALPDPINDVVFCVGVLRKSEAQSVAASGDGVSMPHLVSTTSMQHLFCSTPAKL
jgi:hypothetical protein